MQNERCSERKLKFFDQPIPNLLTVKMRMRVRVKMRVTVTAAHMDRPEKAQQLGERENEGEE